MKTTMRIALLLLALAPAVHADLTIQWASLSNDGLQILVNFSNSIVSVSPDNVSLTGAQTSIASVGRPLNPTEVTVMATSAIASDNNLKICFSNVTYASTANTNATASGPVCSAVKRDAPARRQTALQALQAVKASSEKSIFASGLVTSSSAGSSGGADISLNPDLGIPGLTSFLNIKKTTQQGADQKSFDSGFRYRNVLLPGWIKNLRGASEADIGQALSAHRNAIYAGSVMDVAGKFEGEPTHFDVTNAVLDAAFSVRSRTLGDAKLHWQGFLIPAALEGGRNLGGGSSTTTTTTSTSTTMTSVTPPASMKPDYISRFKAGAGTTFYYSDWNSTFLVKQVNLEVNAVGRDLFCREAMYDPLTKLDDRRGQGIRGYAQVDLKLYVGQTDKARYGIKLSYDRGSLPPVFARVASLQFGFLYETKDDTIKTQ